MLEHLNSKWVEKFMSATSIESHLQTGKLLLSAIKQELMECEVAFELSVPVPGFCDG